MQIRFFFIPVLLVFSFTVFSQSLLAEFPPIKPKTDIDNLLVAHEKGSGFLLAYATNENIVIQSIDKEGKPIAVNGKAHGQKWLVPQGILTDEQAYHFIYLNEQEKKFVILSVNKLEESSHTLQIFSPFEPKEKYIATIVSNDKFYTLGWDKNKETLNVHSYNTRGNRFDIKSIPINDDLADKLKYPITVITNITIPEPIIAMAPQKMYLLPSGKIAITIEGKNYGKCQTELVLIDLDKGEAKFENLGRSVATDRTPTNSYIYGNRIAMYRIERDYLLLYFQDLDSLKLINGYRLTNKDTLKIMDSRLFSETTIETSSVDYQDLIKEKPKKVLYKLSLDIPFLYFEPDGNGNFVFTIGNVIEQGGGISGGSPTMAYGSMPIGAPGIITSHKSSYKFARYFYSVMKETTFEHVPCEATQKRFLSKKLKDFVSKYIEAGGIFTSDPAYQIVNIPGADYALVVSYFKKEGLIKLHKIEL